MTPRIDAYPGKVSPLSSRGSSHVLKNDAPIAQFIAVTCVGEIDHGGMTKWLRTMRSALIRANIRAAVVSDHGPFTCVHKVGAS